MEDMEFLQKSALIQALESSFQAEISLLSAV